MTKYLSTFFRNGFEFHMIVSFFQNPYFLTHYTEYRDCEQPSEARRLRVIHNAKKTIFSHDYMSWTVSSVCCTINKGRKEGLPSYLFYFCGAANNHKSKRDSLTTWLSNRVYKWFRVAFIHLVTWPRGLHIFEVVVWGRA